MKSLFLAMEVSYNDNARSGGEEEFELRYEVILPDVKPPRHCSVNESASATGLELIVPGLPDSLMSTLDISKERASTKTEETQETRHFSFIQGEPTPGNQAGASRALLDVARAGTKATSATLKKEQRAKRQLVRDDEKDEKYWAKRAKNNEAVRKSRKIAKEKKMKDSLAKMVAENKDLKKRWSALRIQQQILRCDAILYEIELLSKL